jgi:acyl-CoA thioesterase-1
LKTDAPGGDVERRPAREEVVRAVHDGRILLLIVTWERLSHALCALTLVVCVGCGAGDATVEPRAEAGPAPQTAQSAGVQRRPRIVALGDSLTAGLGLDAGLAYPALLQQRLDEGDLKYEVVNAGRSGDTSAGGLRRVDWALEGDVRVLIVALGGNDALRGLPVEQLRENVSAIIERAQARGVTVLLAGMEAPTNFGGDYTSDFHHVYPDLARKYGVAFVPFLLEGVAGVAQMNQDDGLHPTAEGARKVADNIWAALQPIVRTHD